MFLSFPRSEKPVEDTEDDNQDSAPHSGARAERRSRTRAKVLLVEDDLTVAGLTAQMLESIGMSVVHVKSAAAALDALAATREIDIVFSDVMMPGGMSGVELAREIRERFPEMPVVLTTGYIEVARSAVTEGLRSARQAVSTRSAVPHSDCEPVAARRRSALAVELRYARYTRRGRKHRQEKLGIHGLDQVHVESGLL